MTTRRVAMASLALGLAASVLGFTPSTGFALQLNGTYYTLNNAHVDAQGGIDETVVSGLVNSTLVGGRPAWSGTSAPNSGPISDTTGGAGTAIQWWTVHTAGPSVVALDLTVGALGNRTDVGTATSFLPTGFTNSFYAAGLSSNETLYRAVHWTGSFHIDAPVNLSLAADDDAWLFLQGPGFPVKTLAMDNGGVKPITAITPLLLSTPGDYTLDLFFADRHQTQSGIAFLCTPVDGGTGCTEQALNPVPEPATLLLLGTTLAGLGAVVRRRMKGQPTLGA